jgi:hypothetical protein
MTKAELLLELEKKDRKIKRLQNQLKKEKLLKIGYINSYCERYKWGIQEFDDELDLDPSHR